MKAAGLGLLLAIALAGCSTTNVTNVLEPDSGALHPVGSDLDAGSGPSSDAPSPPTLDAGPEATPGHPEGGPAEDAGAPETGTMGSDTGLEAADPGDAAVGTDANAPDGNAADAQDPWCSGSDAVDASVGSGCALIANGPVPDRPFGTTYCPACTAIVWHCESATADTPNPGTGPWRPSFLSSPTPALEPSAYQDDGGVNAYGKNVELTTLCTSSALCAQVGAPNATGNVQCPPIWLDDAGTWDEDASSYPNLGSYPCNAVTAGPPGRFTCGGL